MTVISLNNQRRSVKSQNTLQHCSCGRLECNCVAGYVSADRSASIFTVKQYTKRQTGCSVRYSSLTHTKYTQYEHGRQQARNCKSVHSLGRATSCFVLTCSLSVHYIMLFTYVIKQQTHIYKYVQSHILIPNQHLLLILLPSSACLINRMRSI